MFLSRVATNIVIRPTVWGSGKHFLEIISLIARMKDCSDDLLLLVMMSSKIFRSAYRKSHGNVVIDDSSSPNISSIFCTCWATDQSFLGRLIRDDTTLAIFVSLCTFFFTKCSHGAGFGVDRGKRSPTASTRIAVSIR